jgi:transposase
MIEQKELFAAALGLRKPWTLENVEFDPLKGQLDIYIEKIRNEKVECPVCHKECSTHDSKKRTWRHLNFFQHEAYIHCKVPRSKCDEHGVKQVEVPWARPGSGFTLLFEAFMMQLIPHMPVKAAAEQANIYSDVLWRMIDHYVSEAYEEVDMSDVENIGIDETSNKRGHNYVTTFVDMNKSKVIFATEGKDSKTVEKFAEELEKHDGNTEKIENISCDMSKAFRKGIRENFDESKVTYDQFHVIKLANSAVNEVRKIESKINELLKGTRYIWLKNPENLTIDQEKMMKALSKTNLKTERAYRIKRTLQEFYKGSRRTFKEVVLLGNS